MDKKSNEIFKSLQNNKKLINTERAFSSPEMDEFNTQDENPFDQSDLENSKIGAYSGDYQGAFSLEKFATASSLNYTHDDAYYWLKYLEQFKPSNFWYGDENVKIWAYQEQYDNWQDTYGMDAVKAVYHSGHGGMANDGRFWVPLGQDWGGLGTNAFSDQMTLGNEQARYIFWSTCVSLRVTGGHSPIRTWGSQPNPGFRMIFGYDSNSVDNKYYGKKFWQEWNKGKSFSKAFMDASWDISTNQRPSVAACGASQNEAKNRVYNERLFYWGKVSHNWWWWRWYFKSAPVSGTRQTLLELPSGVLIPQVARPISRQKQLKNIVDRFNLNPTKKITANSMGDTVLHDGTTCLSVGLDGSYEIQLAQPNIDNKKQINTNRAIDIANNYLRRYEINSEKLELDSVGFGSDAGATDQGSGEIIEPAITETILRFVQKIEGIPVISNMNGGAVTVRIDNDGSITSLANSCIKVDDLKSPRKPFNSPTPGEDEKSANNDPKQAINKLWQNMLKDWIIKGDMPLGFVEIPGSFEVGYAAKGTELIPIARQEIEVECGGCQKRYLLEAPLCV